MSLAGDWPQSSRTRPLTFSQKRTRERASRCVSLLFSHSFDMAEVGKNRRPSEAIGVDPFQLDAQSAVRKPMDVAALFRCLGPQLEIQCRRRRVQRMGANIRLLNHKLDSLLRSQYANAQSAH